MKQTGKILSALLTAALLAAHMPAAVFAADSAFTPEVSAAEVSLGLNGLRQEAGKVTVSGVEEAVRVSVDCEAGDLVHTEDEEKKIGLTMSGIQTFPDDTETFFV